MPAVDLRNAHPRVIRTAARAGRHATHTVGLAPRQVRGNVVILLAADAQHFLRYCQRNPKPCPLIAVGEPGDPMLPSLGAVIDIRRDVPRYRVWRDGQLAAEPTAVADLWHDDFVSFVLGCSFSFEQSLIDEGIPLRHVASGCNVSMYRTSVATQPAGPFGGPLVVTMPALEAAEAIRTVQITSRYPAVHGAPVQLGDPRLIGIRATSDAPTAATRSRCAANENPLFGVDSIPFLADGYAAAKKLAAASRPAIEKLLLSQGLKLLFVSPWPGQSLYSAKPIDSPADLKGTRMRAYNPATSRSAQLLGAQPTTI